jgi:predicted  nucleic acid-binding Zn-ribbon protein
MLKDVDQAALTRLLDLQTEDTALRRLVQRRDNLPEAQRLAELKDSLSELSSDLEIAGKQRDEVSREQDRLEGEISLADQKLSREEQRLFSGSVANPRELASLQAEVEMLKRKRAELEDKLLEVMVQRDETLTTIDRLKREESETAAEVRDLSERVSSIDSEIATELEGHKSARDAIVAELPTELVTLYESIRDSKGGIGVARLVGGTCDGCHTQLPARDAERVRTEGGLQRCDNCRRILVAV